MTPDTRRDFLKKALLAAAGGGPAGTGLFSGAISRALAIDPPAGSTFLDAEHVVILMQENRSFDHCYGTLRGVRGFSDPRAITLPDGLPVWLQTNSKGETHAPFPLGMTESKSTWMQSLPHAWADQTEARRDGHHDRWLVAKASGVRAYAHLPMTLGFYTRQDLPFYHELADAFTICDQNFCSSLTGTTPNRLFLWTGTLRADGDAASFACVRNSDVSYGSEASWTTFPERLETLGISWKVYQNDISAGTGLNEEEEAWLANFTDNPLEWFTQYQVRFSPAHHAWLNQKAGGLEDYLTKSETAGTASGSAEMQKARRQLEQTRMALARWNPEDFAAQPERARSLHQKAFTNNSGDPAWHRLEELKLPGPDGGASLNVPAGDAHYQFRKDVREGQLPAVSWLVAPQHFSDHPESPWYGAWYLAEAFNILTQNPEVWRKTIFILCYDENDGWFDHLPPFTAPVPGRPETGAVSEGLDTDVEYVTLEQEKAWKLRNPRSAITEGTVGLGYRVPLVIASPWSRGGQVCSQVFDHTSILQFLEIWLSHRSGKTVRESNIGTWRRAVCGNLTSVFQPWNGEPVPLPPPVAREAWLGAVYEAKNQGLPKIPPPLTDSEKQASRQEPRALARLPRQEKGPRPSCALPYELAVTPEWSADSRQFTLTFSALTTRFGGRSAGAAFNVYAPPPRGHDWAADRAIRPRSYSVAPGALVSGTWDLAAFPDGRCRLQVHGPNGWFRAWDCAPDEPRISIQLQENTPAQPRHQLTLALNLLPGKNPAAPLKVRIAHSPLHGGQIHEAVLASLPGKDGGAGVGFPVDLSSCHGWYDLVVTLPDFPQWVYRAAGRMEDGLPGWSDPALSA